MYYSGSADKRVNIGKHSLPQVRLILPMSLFCVFVLLSFKNQSNINAKNKQEINFQHASSLKQTQISYDTEELREWSPGKVAEGTKAFDADRVGENLVKGKLCPEKMMRDQLSYIDSVPVDISPSTKTKYLTFLFSGGLNNCLIALEKALIVAANTNRTLLIPYLESDHVKEGPGSSNSIYEEFKFYVNREGFSRDHFIRMKYRKYSRDHAKDRETMKKMVFRTYFKLKQIIHPDMKLRFAHGLTEDDDHTPGLGYLNVAFIEDNPEFWASKTWYCPMYNGKGFSSKNPYFDFPSFKFVNENDQFMCLGKSFQMTQQAPGGFNPSHNHMGNVEFSKTVHLISNALLSRAGMTPGKYIGVHNRRGDFKAYCKGIEKKRPGVLDHCYPTYKHIMEVIKEFIERKEVQEKLNFEEVPEFHRAIPFVAEGVELPDKYPTFVATNEMNKEIIEGLERDAGWVFLDTICAGLRSEACQDASSYPFLRPVLDAALLYRSGGLVFNNYSTLSRRLVSLRRAWRQPGLEIRV